jgi:hypothetical protein
MLDCLRRNWRKEINMKKDSHSEFYNLVSKDIKKWIDKKFPKERKIVVEGKKGAQSRFSNKDLLEIVLEVKKELRGEEIHPSRLQEITGIGRQTWARRIPEEIDRLNKPVLEVRDFGIDEHDEINHTNIDMIVEHYGNNPRELVNHLYHLEESRIRYYEEAKELKIRNEKLLKYETEKEKLSKENQKLKEELAHYIHLSETFSVSSFFPELRKKVGVKEDVINLKSNPEKNTKISNLHQLFPTNQEAAASMEIVEDKILGSNRRKAGQDLVNELMDEFGDLMN